MLCLKRDTCFFFFKRKTAYEMRISDWSSDVCSSDLLQRFGQPGGRHCQRAQRQPGEPAMAAKKERGLPGSRHVRVSLKRRGEAPSEAKARRRGEAGERRDVHVGEGA